jgi:hypothetical protein
LGAGEEQRDTAMWLLSQAGSNTLWAKRKKEDLLQAHLPEVIDPPG